MASFITLKNHSPGPICQPSAAFTPVLNGLFGRTRTAKKSWSSVPQTTTRRLILLRLFDIR